MECSKCHGEIKSGQEVCLSCGHILGYESEVSKKCIHCNRSIPVSYKKCPYCKKKQSSKRIYLIFIFIIAVILLNIHIIGNIFDNNFFKIDENIVSECVDVSYEELVRRNVYYDESYVQIIGKVSSVEKISSLFNAIKITLYTDENESNIVEVIYNNKLNYGLIKDDNVVVYGKMKRLDGNIPVIKAMKIEIE